MEKNPQSSLSKLRLLAKPGVNVTVVLNISVYELSMLMPWLASYAALSSKIEFSIKASELMSCIKFCLAELFFISQSLNFSARSFELYIAKRRAPSSAEFLKNLMFLKWNLLSLMAKTTPPCYA